MRGDARDGEESEGGAVRADSHRQTRLPHTRVIESIDRRMPVRGFGALGPDWASFPVHITTEVDVMLED